ncbi:MAG: putative glycosyl transferase, group 1 family protein [Rhodocyclaceae bacterium]|nr:putative glycosyl transferase, group 1 family protein [Rhodocyclaceae bacterium]
MPQAVAYLVNQYPMVSHSFVRREIHALERQGCAVLRLALRGWDAELVDRADHREQAATRYILGPGLAGLLWSGLGAALERPRNLLSALRLALGMARRSDRPLPYHLAYLLEACRCLHWMREFGATHVHAHFGTNSAEVAMLAAALGGEGYSYSFTVHGPEEFDRPEAIGLPEKIRRAAFVAAVSSYGRGQLYRWATVDDWSKLEVVRCGLEAAFHPLAPTPPEAAPRLVCVGRLCRQKGQLLLLEAAARLVRQGQDFDLILAGDGEMRPEIEAAIARLGLESRVRITGWITGAEVRREILAARALVLPSFAEGLPVVLMEALALGRPVLTTWIAGIPELVVPGENGWLFPSGSVDDLAAAMADCLALPMETLMRMGEAGQARVLRQHCVDREAARLAELFGRRGEAGEAAPAARPASPAESGP